MLLKDLIEQLQNAVSVVGAFAEVKAEGLDELAIQTVRLERGRVALAIDDPAFDIDGEKPEAWRALEHAHTALQDAARALLEAVDSGAPDALAHAAAQLAAKL